MLTCVANAFLLHNESCSYPLPERVGGIPDLHDRLNQKRVANLKNEVVRASRLFAHRDPDHLNRGASHESTQCAALVDAVYETKTVIRELDTVLGIQTGDCLNRRLGNQDETENAPLNPKQEPDSVRSPVPPNVALNEPVFECLSAPELLGRLKQAVGQYKRDIDVKRALLEHVVTGAEQSITGGWGSGDTNGDDASQNDSKNVLKMTHETLTTFVATWILSPNINQAEREEFDAIVAAETK